MWGRIFFHFLQECKLTCLPTCGRYLVELAEPMACVGQPTLRKKVAGQQRWCGEQNRLCKRIERNMFVWKNMIKPMQNHVLNPVQSFSFQLISTFSSATSSNPARSAFSTGPVQAGCRFKWQWCLQQEGGWLFPITSWDANKSPTKNQRNHWWTADSSTYQWVIQSRGPVNGRFKIDPQSSSDELYQNVE